MCKHTIFDKNGVVLKEGDRIRQTTFYRGKQNGHVYKTIKWLVTRSMTGWNIGNGEAGWEKVI